MFQYNDTKLTAEAIDSLFVNIQRSEKDSNKEIKENETLAYWRDFLQEVEGKYSAKIEKCCLQSIDDAQCFFFFVY